MSVLGMVNSLWRPRDIQKLLENIQACTAVLRLLQGKFMIRNPLEWRQKQARCINGALVVSVKHRLVDINQGKGCCNHVNICMYVYCEVKTLATCVMQCVCIYQLHTNRPSNFVIIYLLGIVHQWRCVTTSYTFVVVLLSGSKTGSHVFYQVMQLYCCGSHRV